MCFLVPALFFSITNVIPIYVTAVLRIISTHLLLSLHYVFVDKDNYEMKLSQKQLQREKKDYLVGIILHMWAQVVLQLLFPGMFFSDDSLIPFCIQNTILAHVFVVEPLYYVVHRWLHVPEVMKDMHSFHHLSISTVPSTSLVQNFKEHFIYIATFGPAMLLPFFVTGTNHWIVVAGYLVVFDIVNAFGHTNIRCRHWLFENKWSPLRYMIYTPEFHLGHHAYFTYNYGLFMPVWDHLFGTYREYKKPELLQPSKSKQDFVFIGHNGGLGHLLTVPEVSVYNVYDQYVRSWLPIELEFLIVSLVSKFMRLFMSSYKVSRYLVDGKNIGRVICVLRTPLDYVNAKKYAAINKDMINLIREQYETCGTRYFGLGNLNKMKQLNDGGQTISQMVAADPFLKDKDIRVWTGDTLTAASVYQQLMAIPNLKQIFYIGAGGKIGNAVCKMLVEKNISICIFSKYVGFEHPNVTYTQDIKDMASYKFVLIGKHLKSTFYEKTLDPCNFVSKSVETRYLLDYTVPFMHLRLPATIQHVQIGVLKTTSNTFLKGHFDICFGIEENHIYPCHAGCILNMLDKRESDETGEIDLADMGHIWSRAKKHGLENKEISFD